MLQFLDACEKFGIVNVEKSQNAYVGALVLKQPLDYRERPFYQLLLRASVSSCGENSRIDFNYAASLRAREGEEELPRLGENAPDNKSTRNTRRVVVHIGIAAKFGHRANLRANENESRRTFGTRGCVCC